MTPRMEADFDWGEVQASTPIYDKGEYELSIRSVRGSAWAKKDAHGNPTNEITRVVRLRPVMVGQVDSKGKLNGDKAGEPVEDINLWVHSDGGRRMAKGYMMAICGYNPRDTQSENEFNNFLATSKLDLGASVEEVEDGSGGLTLKLGDGWETLLVGKNVRVAMEPETRTVEGREPILQQNFTRLSPVNAT